MAEIEHSASRKAQIGNVSITASRVRSFVIQDHDSNDIALVWYHNGKDSSYGKEDLPPFPFQVYLTDGATHTAHDRSFPERFACFIEKLGGIANGDCHYRFEVYSKPFQNILACVEHQRKETWHRNQNGIWPRIVSNWTYHYDGGYKGRIIVIDRDDWESEGIVLVHFDPSKYDHSSEATWWNQAGDGDAAIIHARLHHALGEIPIRLTECWFDAGFGWTEADLARRNDGGISPALYPAVDPMSHYDVEHEDVHELDGTTLPGPATQFQPDEDDDGVPKIVDTFDRSELFKREDELRSFTTEIYSDSFGLPISSVWSPSRSKIRPSFSFTLYMAFDVLPIHPKALFSCLNKGLVEQEAWTLDIVNNMPSLDAAFEYHTRATARRTAERIRNRAACMHMLLYNIAGSRLPAELLENIEAILVPPEIPQTALHPCRQFRNTFLYFDSSCLSTGPLLIYSNPVPYCTRSKRIEGERDTRTFDPERDTPSQQTLHKVTNLRFWHRVADEIHIVWSMCSSRAQVHADQIPRISLKIELPEVCSPNPISRVSSQIGVSVILESCETITIHRKPFLSHDLWWEALEIVDVDTSEVVPQLPCKAALHFHKYCNASWAQSPQLGFGNIGLNGVQHFNLCTLQPGLSEDVLTGPFIQFWEEHHRRGQLVDGRKYALRLRPDVVVPRWTYGSIGDLKGPFNLPPLPVAMDDQPQFIFRYIQPKESMNHS